MPEKINFYNLVFETTRRCNMHCAHCLRGDPGRSDMKIETVIPLLDRTESIESIVFSGGEPTLNVTILKDLLKEIKKRNISVNSFYIVTNGKKVTMDFLDTMLKWYAYCAYWDSDTNAELSGLALSKDKFHEPIPYYHECLLKGLSFFRDDKFIDFNRTKIIDIGRAKTLDSTNKRYHDQHEEVGCYIIDNGIFIETDIAVTTDGLLLPTCDYEYDMTNDISVGDIKDMNTFMQYLTDIAH